MMFHGTDYHREVMAEGLVPNARDNHDMSVSGYVYLAFTPDYAFEYVGERGRILEVDIDESELVEDPASPAAMYEGTIPPEKISYWKKSKQEERRSFKFADLEIKPEAESLGIDEKLPFIKRLESEEQASCF